MAGKKNSKSGEVSDMDLWERVRNSAKPLDPARRNHHVQDEIKAYLKSGGVSKPVAKPISLPAFSPAAEPKAVPTAGMLDHNTWRKISRGRTPIDRRIDLHGLTHDEAHQMLVRFLEAARLQGARTVLVITGKGKMGEGVLRRSLPAWLAEPAIRSMISGYREAHSAHGGSGAWYVRLRKSDR